MPTETYVRCSMLSLLIDCWYPKLNPHIFILLWIWLPGGQPPQQTKPGHSTIAYGKRLAHSASDCRDQCKPLSISLSVIGKTWRELATRRKLHPCNTPGNQVTIPCLGRRLQDNWLPTSYRPWDYHFLKPSPSLQLAWAVVWDQKTGWDLTHNYWCNSVQATTELSTCSTGALEDHREKQTTRWDPSAPVLHWH